MGPYHQFDVPTVRRPSSSTICRTTGIRVPSVRHLSNCWDVELLGFPLVRRPSSSTNSNYWDVELVGIPVVRRPNSSTSQQFDKCRTDGTRIPVVRQIVELLGRRTTGTSNFWDVELLGFPPVRRPSSSTNSNYWDVELVGRRTGDMDPTINSINRTLQVSK